MLDDIKSFFATNNTCFAFFISSLAAVVTLNILILHGDIKKELMLFLFIYSPFDFSEILMHDRSFPRNGSSSFLCLVWAKNAKVTFCRNSKNKSFLGLISDYQASHLPQYWD